MKPAFLLSDNLCKDYSPATIAPIGQASAQVPQSMQAFGSIL